MKKLFPFFRLSNESKISARLGCDILKKVSSGSWQSTVWTVNSIFLLMTVIVGTNLTGNSASRDGFVKYFAQFSLAEERNLATSWEGWCLALISIISFERFLRSKESSGYDRKSWIGLSVLALGLSLDEIGSIHERSSLVVSMIGFSRQFDSKFALALPALLVLFCTLRWLWHLPDRRRFWLCLSAFTTFGAVVIHERLEFIYQWPWWARGIRAAAEEGTELIGVFLLLLTVVPENNAAKSHGFFSLFPSWNTLKQLKIVSELIAILLLLPLGLLTLGAIANQDTAQRGIPASWLPFMLLNLAALTAWARSNYDIKHKNRFLLLASLAVFFAIDQILVLERVMDKNLIRSAAIGSAMFPCMAAVCALIPTLRSKSNMLLVALFFPLSFFSFPSSNLMLWIILPLQCLGIYYIVASGPVSHATVRQATERTSIGRASDLFRQS